MDVLHQSLGTWVKCVDAFVTPSDFTRTKYIAAGWPADKLRVKYNTVGETRSPSQDARRGFVCVSRFSPEKGIDVLLEAWHRAFPQGGEGLALVGSGVSEHRLRSMASAIPGVSFHGQVPPARAVDLLARCRAAVIPSRCYESFSRVVAESFSVGTPVIASSVGALAELVSDGTNGLLSEPGEPAPLAKNLGLLSNSDALVNQFGRAARVTFEERFHPDVTTARLLSIYKIAADSPRSSGRSESPRHMQEV